jgi:diguanylate cyclase (GGDEF)-like protein
MKFATPENEQERLDALHRYETAREEPEQATNDITLLAAKMLGTPIAALSMVDADDQYFKAAYGMPMQRLVRDHSFCARTILNPQEATVIEDARRDPLFRGLDMVRKEPHVRAYAGAPLLTPDGHAIGALCVMDSRPRHFTIEQIEMLRVLARQVVNQFELRHQAVLLTEANEKLSALATSDSLTGLKNHRVFMERLDDEVRYARRNRTPLSLVLMDVDNFKSYNDVFGHPAGDEVLCAVAILLLEASREYDIVARYGGEEFGVILRGADAAEAYAIAERFRMTISEAHWPFRHITASIGVSTFGPRCSTREQLVSETDRLLYLSKTSGKNRVSQAEMDQDFDPAAWDAVFRTGQESASRS